MILFCSLPPVPYFSAFSNLNFPEWYTVSCQTVLSLGPFLLPMETYTVRLRNCINGAQNISSSGLRWFPISFFFSENDWGWKRSTDFHSDVNNRTARSESESRAWVHRKPDKRKRLSEFVKRDKHNRYINGAGFWAVEDVTQHLYSYKYTCKGIAYRSRDQTKEFSSWWATHLFSQGLELWAIL